MQSDLFSHGNSAQTVQPSSAALHNREIPVTLRATKHTRWNGKEKGAFGRMVRTRSVGASAPDYPALEMVMS
jgi:hypothetical protein